MRSDAFSVAPYNASKSAGFLSSAVNSSLRRTRFIVFISKENLGEAVEVFSTSRHLSRPNGVGPSTRGRCASVSEVVRKIASLSELHAFFTAPTETAAFRTKRKE